MSSSEEEDVFPLKLPEHVHPAPCGVQTEDPMNTWQARKKGQRGYRNPPRDSNR